MRALHPLGAYLLHRGLPTLPLRVRRAQETAAVLAAHLVEHPEVMRVHYPTTDERGLLGTQMSGPGSVVALSLRGGYEAARAFVEGVQLATHAVSLGGVDTLVQHPASLTHRPVSAEARPSDGLVRIAVGLEDPADLLADLVGALEGSRLLLA